MNTTAEVVRVKEALAWVEAQRCVQLKAVTSEGKPVELSVAETRKLSERLAKLAGILESMQQASDK